ncbi:MAG TPA: glycoside hydrolase family 25 protein [Candidatus Mediterraneibacter excrementigallinarum]|nr:glycoside hydrolase family 25 protein [Candidatus Mediterraneibacter excrementigallinarum]
MKRARTMIPVLVCLLLLAISAAGGQRKAEKKEQDSATGIRIEEKDGKEYFIFQDVKENSYRAELLENVPKNIYDFSCLSTDEDTGFKKYNDEKNGITSKMGIDVSEFQGGDIDWKQVKDSGIEFVIVRIGYRAYGESGELVKDDMFEQNIEGALDAGLEAGVYFFSQAITPGEAVEEAEFVLDLIRPYKITGPVVYDTEEIKGDTARTDGNTRQEFTNYCKVFCDTVEHAGYDSMIYANMKWMAFTLDMEELTDYDFWYADYHELPQNPYDYTIWQYSETGAVPGINANVDLNIWFEKEG